MGYQEVARDPLFTPGRRKLLKKDVPRCASCEEGAARGYDGTLGAYAAAPSSSKEGGSSGSSGGGSGVGGVGGSKGGAGVFDWSQLGGPGE
jgi:uncharacterized membrane protein YgcG